MTNRNGIPVLDPPRAAPKRTAARESPVSLVLNRCASGCKRLGHWQYEGTGLCDVCLIAAIVRSER